MGFVYLIGSLGHPAVKIGMSSEDPKRRLSQLQTGNPFELVLLWKELVDDPADMEGRLHDHFAMRQIRGEWFDLGVTPVSAFRDAVAVHNKFKEKCLAKRSSTVYDQL
jgi:hypothetical protein